MTAPAEITTLDQALAWGDEWQQHAERLQRELEDALRELSLQKLLADQFADALRRQWAKDKFADI